MYSRRRWGVNAAAGAVAAALGLAAGIPAAQSTAIPPAGACDPAFTRLFTPPHPQLGRYDVCTTGEPIAAVARPGWRIEAAPPLDAFGTAGAYDRAALVRLYGGRPVRVARGWRETEAGFESLTLVSPYPDPSFTRLESGTLIIRLILCCR
jgi:hypothetical protein